jgi:retron-type reverse transcriptase
MQRLVQFGDENTKFFHAMASERYRKNVISQIVDSSGRMIADHIEKSALFYQEFKSRMGCSIPTSLQYQLNNIVPCCGNLDHLCLPFSQEEIENIILDLPSDKAPGPDGFNNLFFKRAWHIIREDFFKLSTDFFNHDVDLKSVNHSYITLVPKIDNPEKVSDFRPISLINSVPKMVANILANRLQKVATQVVHENQYGFVKGKTIQDCLGWAFEFLHQCHQSKREIVILKLDFEKAFDLVEFSIVLDMLRAKGFPDKWILWVDSLLNSATTSVLLNGTAGKEFLCKRGVRQGDPLSPILFAIAADLIQYAINHEFQQERLAPPFPQNADLPFPVVQYADDTIIVMQGEEQQLLILKDILQKIALSSGLKVYYHKSCLVPINIDAQKTELLAASFGCMVGSFPFTYLGLPLGLTKPLVRDFAPSSVEWKGGWQLLLSFFRMLEDFS